MLVVLHVQGNLQPALGIDLIHGNLRGAGHGHAVHRGAAGLRADQADLDGVLRQGGGAHAQNQGQRQNRSGQLANLHSQVPPSSIR